MAKAQRIKGSNLDDVFDMTESEFPPDTRTVVTGKKGYDTVILEGSIFEYNWARGKGGTWEITSLLTDDGTIVLRGVEHVQFDDYFFRPEIDDEVILGLVGNATNEDTLQFTVNAFDFDADEIQFVDAALSDGTPLELLLPSIQLFPDYGGSGEQFLIGVAPSRPAEFLQWQYLAHNEVAIESLEVTVSTTADDGTVSFFDIFFNVEIIGQNDAPVAEAFKFEIEFPDRDTFIDLSQYFTDVDANDTHTFSLTQTDGDAVSYEFDLTTGLITFTDVTGASSASFEWTVTDNHNASATATLDVGFPSPPQGILIDFEEFHPDTGGLGDFTVGGVLSQGIQFSQFGVVVETDEANVTPGWEGFGLAANSPDDPDGMNVMVNGNRQVVSFFDPEGDNFDFESAYMTFLGNENDGTATTGEVTFIAYDGMTVNGFRIEVGQQTFTLTESPTLLEFDDAIFDSVDYVAIVPGAGDRWGMDDMYFLMPVEDVFT